ncbi:uncharacterized protein LY79DRAFT_259720 [Colletotrichum navitas]|uniref:Secreted protein n=1 Tax=Colletotrichum navitas TaxID=681940 RepID=A0AAD8PX17_9PEZI|nr:uncharacterized protein LY79DRAFT_259720 [Colletotrichum navitas]KAK1585750.1 hypothetical protein LY79DRAFT_259720 [Colletotrichum navitas]
MPLYLVSLFIPFCLSVCFHRRPRPASRTRLKGLRRSVRLPVCRWINIRPVRRLHPYHLYNHGPSVANRPKPRYHHSLFPSPTPHSRRTHSSGPASQRLHPPLSPIPRPPTRHDATWGIRPTSSALTSAQRHPCPTSR